jgi:hypothetical protein
MTTHWYCETSGKRGSVRHRQDEGGWATYDRLIESHRNVCGCGSAHNCVRIVADTRPPSPQEEP